MNTRSRTQALAAALGILIASFATAALAAPAIYKWVDKNGEVHFSQTPPPQGNAKEYNPDYATPSAPSEEPAKNAKDAEEKPAADTKGAVTVFNKKDAQKACEAARKQLKMLNDPNNQLMVQGSDGKYHPMSADEKAARIKKAQDIENKACVD